MTRQPTSTRACTRTIFIAGRACDRRTLPRRMWMRPAGTPAQAVTLRTRGLARGGIGIPGMTRTRSYPATVSFSIPSAGAFTLRGSPSALPLATVSTVVIITSEPGTVLHSRQAEELTGSERTVTRDTRMPTGQAASIPAASVQADSAVAPEDFAVVDS